MPTQSSYRWLNGTDRLWGTEPLVAVGTGRRRLPPLAALGTGRRK